MKKKDTAKAKAKPKASVAPPISATEVMEREKEKLQIKPDTQLVAYRPMLHNGVLIEIGDPAPEGLKKGHRHFRNFAPANIAGNMKLRSRYFRKLDARKP